MDLTTDIERIKKELDLVTDIQILDQIEKIILEGKKKSYEKSLKPLTKQELENDVINAVNDIDGSKLYSVNEVDTILKNRYKS